MSNERYAYEDEISDLMTEQGIAEYVLPIRDRMNELIDKAGAVKVEEALRHITGSSHQMLAAIEYLHRNGEFIKLEYPSSAGNTWTQDDVYTKHSARGLSLF